jgi:hypothetical protein
MFFADPEPYSENTLGGHYCYLENGKAGGLRNAKVQAWIHREECITALPTADA